MIAFSKIIITKAKLQAISDAIIICSEKALQNSEVWLYTDSQMTLQRLNSKSNDDIHQNWNIFFQVLRAYAV